MMRKVLFATCMFAVVLSLMTAASCRPPYVEDPARHDLTTYCKTVQEQFGPDQWCIDHGHPLRTP